jgi:D-lactate dehydrogenase (cytochrome)
VPHRIRARAARRTAPPDIRTDVDFIASFLSDAAHVPGGFAAGVALPATEAEVSAVVASASRVLPVGAQSSLTGGATPRGELVLSTRALRTIDEPRNGRVRVGAGVPVFELQRRLAAHRLFYPPAPTFDGAFIGGTIATNAAGPATFKYGSTRPWVEAITVVLADGDLLDVMRGDTTASPAGHFEIQRSTGEVVTVPVPSYEMPSVPKLSAGYVSGDKAADLIDLFIGSEGTLGIVVDASVRVIPLPERAVVLLTCRSDAEAVAVTASLRLEAQSAWRRQGPLDVAAIEYIDRHAVDATPDEAFSRAGMTRPSNATLLLVQIEVHGDQDDALTRLEQVLARHGTDSPQISLPGDERGLERLIGLREAVPASVNAHIAAAKARAPEIQKTAGDMIVPFDRVLDSIALYRRTFERRGLPYAIWGHLSDGNLHPNVLPRSVDEVERGREALLEIARGVMALGGAPLAEHGVGRSALKQRLLRELYGEAGIDQMRAVKRALDPGWKLAPGVLFGPSGGGSRAGPLDPPVGG